MMDDNMTTPQYSKDDNFQTSRPVQTNLFTLSLLTRVSDQGVLYSCPANHRNPINDNLLKCEIDEKSMVEQVYTGEPGVFSGNSVSLLFYQEKDMSGFDVAEHRDSLLTSISRETIRVDNTQVKDVKMKFMKLGVVPSNDQLLKLAYILNVKIAPPCLESKGQKKLSSTPKKASSRLLDYSSVLAAFAKCSPSTNKNLEGFVNKHLQWKCFKVKKQLNFYDNMCRVRSFLQCMHSIGVSYVEGNHRAVLAGKLLYGQPVNMHYPLSHDYTADTRKIPQKSPLFHPQLGANVLVHSFRGRTRAIDDEMLGLCRKRSKQVADNKKLYIVGDWKTFFLTSLERFNPAIYQPVKMKEYLAIEMPQGRKKSRNWQKDDMFDRKGIPYVDKVYQAMEILASCAMTIEPMASSVKSAKGIQSQEDIETLWKARNRIGFGSFSLYGRDPPNPRKGDPLIRRSMQNVIDWREQWRDIASAAIPELFARLAPFQGGLKVLAAFSKADERFLDPLFISAVIVAPVTKIAKVIIDILTNQNLIERNIKNLTVFKRNRVKVQRILEHYYTVRYLTVLQHCQVPEHLPDVNDEEIGKYWESYLAMVADNLGVSTEAQRIGLYGLAPMILVNLPREFERWRDFYGQEGKGIQRNAPPGSKLFRPEGKYLARYFHAGPEEYIEPLIDGWRVFKFGGLIPEDDVVDDDDEDSTYHLPNETVEDDDSWFLNECTIECASAEDADVDLVANVAAEDFNTTPEKGRTENEDQQLDDYMLLGSPAPETEGEQTLPIPEALADKPAASKGDMTLAEVEASVHQETTQPTNEDTTQLPIPRGYDPYIPMDVSLPMHPYIVAAAQYSLPDQPLLKVKNHPEWDPVYIVQGMTEGIFVFGLQDFYNGLVKKRKDMKGEDSKDVKTGENVKKQKGNNDEIDEHPTDIENSDAGEKSTTLDMKDLTNEEDSKGNERTEEHVKNQINEHPRDRENEETYSEDGAETTALKETPVSGSNIEEQQETSETIKQGAHAGGDAEDTKLSADDTGPETNKQDAHAGGDAEDTKLSADDTGPDSCSYTEDQPSGRMVRFDNETFLTPDSHSHTGEARPFGRIGRFDIEPATTAAARPTQRFLEPGEFSAKSVADWKMLWDLKHRDALMDAIKKNFGFISKKKNTKWAESVVESLNGMFTDVQEAMAVDQDEIEKVTFENLKPEKK
jgi:hypothetical protein